MKKKLILVLLIFVFIAVSRGRGEATIESELETVVVTATRMAQHNYKIAGNVTVITSEQIEASNAQNVTDVLNWVQGIYIYDNSTVKSTTVDIRGFGDSSSRNVLVLVNDRRVNAISISGADFTQIPLKAIERIEIIRGAGSVLYGDNAVGGVINIITKKGKGDLSGSLGATYGSYDTQGSDIEASGEFKDFNYYTYSRYLDKRGYRENSDEIYRNFATRVGYDLSDKLKVDIDVGFHKDRYHLPGGLDEAELLSLGRRGSADPSNRASTNDRYYKLTLDLNPWPEDVYFGSLAVDFNYRQRDVFDTFGGYDTDRYTTTQGITGRYIFNRPIFDREANFVTGIDFYDYDNDIRGSKFNPDDLTISKTELGVYGFLEYELLDDIFFNGGTRYHQADYTFNQRDTIRFEEQSPDEWVSMGGVRYEYGEGSNLHANVQQTFRFLATDEWYGTFSGLNTALKQQTGIQYEAGVKHNLNDAVLVTVTPYGMENKNEIFFDPTSGFFGSNSNYDKIRRFGVETGSKVDLLKMIDIPYLDQWEWFANYTYQDTQFLAGPNDGKEVPLVPRHQASTGVLTRFFENFYFSILGRYTGTRFIINDTTNAMPPAKPYFVMDAKLAYKAKFLEAYVEVNNILNEIYSSYQVRKTASTRDHYPAPETNYTAGVKLKF